MEILGNEKSKGEELRKVALIYLTLKDPYGVDGLLNMCQYVSFDLSWIIMFLVVSY